MRFQISKAGVAVTLTFVISSLLIWKLVSCSRYAGTTTPQVFATELAFRSETLREEVPVALDTSLLLATESLNIFPTPEGDHALRAALSLKRKPLAKVQHGEPINAVALSLDGSWVATASDDHKAQIHSVMTGDLLDTLFHRSRVTHVMFSPDSTLMATGSFDGGIGLYDLSHKKKSDPLAARGAIIWLAVANNNIVAVGTTTHFAQVFDVNTRQETVHVERNDLRVVALDTEGKLLATAGGNLVQVMKIATQKEFLTFSHTGIVNMIAFSPRDHLLVSASDDGTVQLHDTESGRLVGQPLHHGAKVKIIAFSEDGQLLSTADENGIVRIYEVSDKCKLIASIADQGTVTSLGFASGNAVVVTARTDHTVRMYELITGREIARVTHEAAVTHMAVSNHSMPIVASAGGNLATVVAVTRGQGLIPLPGQPNVSHAAFNSNGTVAVTNGATVTRFNVSDGGQLTNAPTPDYEVTNLSYSPDGRFLAMVKQNGITPLCDLYDGTDTQRIANSAEIVAVSFSGDSAILAIAGNSTLYAGQDQAFVWIFDLQTRKQRIGPPIQPGQARSVAVSPDHKFVVLGTSRGAYVTSVGEQRRLLYPESITAINFSRDGSRVALGTAIGTIYVFDPANGQKIFGPANAEGTVTDVQFAEDNNIVAAVSNEGILHVFDIYENMEIGRFPRTDVKAFTFGKGTLITLSVDEEGPFLQTHKLGAQSLTEQACSLLSRNLSPEEWKLYMGTRERHKTCERLPD